MGEDMLFYVVDALFVQLVDAYAPAGVNDLSQTYVYAYMYDTALWVAEKTEIIGHQRIKPWHPRAIEYLLRGIARQLDATHTKNDLCKTRTVYAHQAFAAPQIRCMQ